MDEGTLGGCAVIQVRMVVAGVISRVTGVGRDDGPVWAALTCFVARPAR